MNNFKFLHFFCFCFIVLSLDSCSTKKISSEISMKKALIFIPGFKGSYLKDVNSKEIVWITAYEAIFGNSTLNYQKTKLIPEGIINKVNIVPGIYSLNIYQQFLLLLQKKLPADTLLVNFAYDWRSDNYQQVIELAKVVKNLKNKGINKISLVGHSMGGLIAAYYLRYGEQDPRRARENWAGAKEINSSVIIASPFKGSLLMVHDLIKGVKTLRNTSLLNAESLQSFPSCYQLLPRSDNPQLLNQSLVSENVDFLEEEFWQKYNLLHYIDNKTLKKYLIQARNFSDLLLQPTDHDRQKSKLLFIQGQGYPTLDRLICRENLQPPCIFPEDKESLPYSKEVFLKNGDGIVTTESATLPLAYQEDLNCSTMKINGEHLEMINDSQLMETVLNFINK